MEQQKEKQVFEKRNFYTDDDSGKVFIISLLAPLFISLLIFLLCGAIVSACGLDAQTQLESTWFIAVSSVLTSLTFVGIYLIYNKYYKIDNRAVAFNFKIGWKNYLIAVVISVIALFGLQQLISSFDALWETIGYNLSSISINPTNFGLFALLVLVSAITPAICEEIIFRGMILNGLRTKFNDYASIALSAFMFALIHGNLQQFIYPFLLGLIYGWLCLRTGSVIPSIIAHFVNNFLVVLLQYLANVTGFSMIMPIEWWSILIAILLAVIVFVVIYLLDRFIYKHKSFTVVEKQEGKVSLFLWASLALSGLIFLYNLVAAFV